MAKLLRGTVQFALQRGGELSAAQRSGGPAEQDARRGSGAVVAAAGWGLGFQGGAAWGV